MLCHSHSQVINLPIADACKWRTPSVRSHTWTHDVVGKSTVSTLMPPASFLFVSTLADYMSIKKISTANHVVDETCVEINKIRAFLWHRDSDAAQ